MTFKDMIPTIKKYLMFFLIGSIIILLLGLLKDKHLNNANNETINIKGEAIKVMKKEPLNVPLINQLPSLPTGCESASTAMFLQWAGLSISMEEIANDLPKGPLPYISSGELIGGNPDYEFVGDPFLASGFGVYHQPIRDIINKYLPNEAEDMTGCEFEQLLEVIDSNRPIIVWGTIDNKTASINAKWHDDKGNLVVWKSPQHTMVLVDYNDSYVIVNDPLLGKKAYYDIMTFRTNWEYMGKQAITLRKATTSR